MGKSKSNQEVTFFISSVLRKSHFEARKFYTSDILHSSLLLTPRQSLDPEVIG